MPFARRARCRLYYEVTGDPLLPALVLVRGLARSSRYWGALIPHLARFHVVLVDNRGVGRSDAPWPPYSSRQLADDVAAVMDAAGIDRAHVFGMSLGGMIVQQLALAHAARIDRLVIGCSTPGGRRAHRASIRALLQLRDARDVDRQLAILVSEATPELREHWLAIARDEPARWRGVLGQVAAGLRHDVYDRLGDITHPTLVITGDDDVIIPPANSRLLAERIPNATLVVLAGARHDFTSDRPVESARAITEFLEAR
ncbi:MAG TPA: alpha/beta hydrolase [Kofleriaceae bacterium]|jgi:pimeloyl-ACP methyl ester carboxylesterase|nr:alpha/beta hydrolase [Kofleriaceae bacterium]